MVVSIRAPVKDATHPNWRGAYERARFYPRAREGRDNYIDTLSSSDNSFYPRAREGRDEYSKARQPSVHVSIRAPVKDATVPASASAATLYCFYPRAREGRDAKSLIAPLATCVSIRAPVKDATRRLRD